jgi:lysophospholipid acyltransferase (LPLAT)-like uncharacterized protein
VKIPPNLAARAAGPLVRGLAATWRFRYRPAPTGEPEFPGDGASGAGGWRERPGPGSLPTAIYAAWHEQLLPLAFLHAHQNMVALVSQHRDGEILTRFLATLGYETARGSSTRGGEGAVRELVAAGNNGKSLAFTPDGPRGPARHCKPGAVRVAAATGLAVVPTAAAARPCRRLSSWDRFVVPLPGARIWASHGPPVRVPREVADAWVDGQLEDRDVVRHWTSRIARGIDEEVGRCRHAADLA